MIILAKAPIGKEFIYNARTAHKVSKAKADEIMETLNRIQYKLNPGETWYQYEIDNYSNAIVYAERQSFTVYKGTLREKRV